MPKYLSHARARTLMSTFGRLTVMVALLGGMSACKKNDQAQQDPSASTTAPASARADLTASCESDGRVQKYAPGLKVAGNSHNLTFVVTAAEPTLPAGGKNKWTVQILSAAGAPTTEYTLTAAPYMPDHAHGPSAGPEVKAQGQNYEVSNIDFFMGGVWRTTLTAKDAKGAIVDAANVFLCIPG